MAGNDSEERKLPPSENQLRKLRREGTVPRSRDFVSAAGLVGLLLYFVIASSYLFLRFRDAVSSALDPNSSFEAGLAEVVPAVARTAAAIMLPVVFVLMLSTLLASMAVSGGFVPSPKALAASFSKLSPAEGVKRVFSLSSLIDFVKSLARLALVLIGFWLLVRHYLNDMFWAPTCGASCVLQVFRSTIGAILGVGTIIIVVIATADIPISRWLFRRDHRMSVTEKKREDREEFGAPELLQARRELRQQVMTQLSMRGIEKATVLLVSGEAAVGLAYIKNRTPAPYW
jgi:type III secretion protein U